MPLAVARSVFAALLSQAAAAAPNEACGLLLGSPDRAVRAVPARNVHPTPQTHFEIDPAALIAAHKAERQRGAAIAGYWHSHPGGGAAPSTTDQASASGDGKIWAIVAAGEVAFWRDLPGGFEALPYQLVDG
jgi:proteasome lid subunit RPN8/RPN11